MAFDARRAVETAAEKEAQDLRESLLTGSERVSLVSDDVTTSVREEKKLLKRIFGWSCLAKSYARDSAAAKAASLVRTSLAKSLFIVFTGLSWNEWSRYQELERRNERFIPAIDLISSISISTTIRAEVQCRNQMRQVSVPSEGTDTNSRLSNGFRSLRAYAPWTISGVGIYLGLTATQDYFEGELKSASEYAKVGAYTLVWDFAMAGTQAFLLDDVFIRKFPLLRERFTQLLEQKLTWVNLGAVGKVSIVGLPATAIPGLTAELMTLTQYQRYRAHFYMEGLEWFLQNDSQRNSSPPLASPSEVR